jgi:hypothetical protein
MARKSKQAAAVKQAPARSVVPAKRLENPNTRDLFTGVAVYPYGETDSRPLVVCRDEVLARAFAPEAELRPVVADLCDSFRWWRRADGASFEQLQVDFEEKEAELNHAVERALAAEEGRADLEEERDNLSLALSQSKEQCVELEEELRKREAFHDEAENAKERLNERIDVLREIALSLLQSHGKLDAKSAEEWLYREELKHRDRRF